MNKNETREEYNARMREYMRTQYKKKRDEQVRQWKEKNKEHVCEYFKTYYKNNKEEIKAQSREYYQKKKGEQK